MERSLCVVLVVIVFTATALGQQLYEGQSCKYNGSPGLCKKMDSCPKAQAELSLGKRPTICMYEGFTPIVCCPDSAPSRPPTTQSPNVRKATQKCTEYAEYVWRYVRPISLPIGIDAPPVKIDLCPQPKISLVIGVGGEEANAREFPHMALVGFGEKKDIFWWCGGSLISPRYVLTAGHCLSAKNKGDARWVRLGEHNLKQDNDTARPRDFEIVQRIPHPDYNPPSSYNDIALLKLGKDVEMDEFVRPACLHTEETILKTIGIATGWGLTHWAESEGSDVLIKVLMPFQSTETCNKAYKSLTGTSRLRNGIYNSSMVCAGYLEGRMDTCKGDSGGPLQFLLEEPYCMYDIVGITSFGKTVCGAANSPGVFTRVSHFVPWIESIVWP